MTQGLFQFSNSIINEIINFSISSYGLLYMEGPKGSSKSEIIEHAALELMETNLIFRHVCFEHSVIDDFLLNFYDELKDFSLARRISLKKFTGGDFKEKVSHYFKEIRTSCIIVIENFEKVQNNTEIIDFLAHLATFINVKIIIASRLPRNNTFNSVRVKDVYMEPISKENFKIKLKTLNQNISDELADKFFEITQGLELYLNMVIKYCSNTNVTIVDLIYEFERKNMDFENFIVSKFISLTPSIYKDSFRILCMLSHPVSIKFLNEYNLADTSRIEYLLNNFLLSKVQDEVYVKEYFKKFVLDSISIQEKVSYYTKLTEIYENELTKSPKDRILRLSRESIRKEIEEFNSLTPIINQKPFIPLNYAGLANFSVQDMNKSGSLSLSEKFKRVQERKKILTKKKFNEEEETRKIQEQTRQMYLNEKKEKERKAVIEFINTARELNSNYHYKEAISTLINALEIDKSGDFKIELYIMVAKNYQSLDEYLTAQKYYKIALEYAQSTNDIRKAELEYLIAMTNKNLYKIDVAKNDFIKIIADESNSFKYRALSSIELGEIEEADSHIPLAIKHYQNALSFALGKDKKLTCKSYYKLAVLYDEENDIEHAIEYYKKNYKTSSEKSENRYYSISLTNLALIYIEQMRYDEACDYLKMALSYDSENNDLESMFFSQRELANLYAKTGDNQKAMSYFKQALTCAQTLNDKFKIAFVHFEAGEFLYDTASDKEALKEFLMAKEALKDNPKDENIERINSRIKDLQVRLDEKTFNETLGNFKDV